MTPTQTRHFSTRKSVKRPYICIKFDSPEMSARWAPTSYKWSYNPCKWITGVITPINGVITLLITGFWAHLVEFNDSHTKSWWSHHFKPKLPIPSMPAQNGSTPTSVCKTAPLRKVCGWVIFFVFFQGKMS